MQQVAACAPSWQGHSLQKGPATDCLNAGFQKWWKSECQLACLFVSSWVTGVASALQGCERFRGEKVDEAKWRAGKARTPCYCQILMQISACIWNKVYTDFISFAKYNIFLPWAHISNYAAHRPVYDILMMSDSHNCRKHTFSVGVFTLPLQYSNTRPPWKHVTSLAYPEG